MVGNRRGGGRRGGNRGGRGAGRVGLDEESQLKWLTLNELRCLPSRYADNVCTAALGIHDDVWQLFQNVGFAAAMQGRWPSYRYLMLEFLSTLKVTKTMNPVKIVHIDFQLGHQPRRLTLAEVNEIFGSRGGYTDSHPEYNRHDWWNAISRAVGEDRVLFRSQSEKATRIRNPVFRYIQRVLASSLFARHDNGTITTTELFMLWCMVGKHPVDLATPLIEHLNRASKKDSGILMVGGVITRIAESFGIDFQGEELIPGEMSVGLAVLDHMGFIRYDSYRRYYITQHSTLDYPLPHPALTRVADMDNWAMSTPAHTAHAESRRAVLPYRAVPLPEGEVPDVEFPNEDREMGDIPESSAAAGRRRPRSRSQRSGALESEVHGLRESFGVMQGTVDNIRTDVTGIQETMEVLDARTLTMQTDLQMVLQMMQQWGPNPWQQPPGP